MKRLIDYLLKNYYLLDDLCGRLQDDYNDIQAFEQTEEDRIIIYNILELLDEYKNTKGEWFIMLKVKYIKTILDLYNNGSDIATLDYINKLDINDTTLQGLLNKCIKENYKNNGEFTDTYGQYMYDLFSYLDFDFNDNNELIYKGKDVDF